MNVHAPAPSPSGDDGFEGPFTRRIACTGAALSRLKSVPARFGALRSIRLVRPIHLFAVVFYTSFGLLAGLGAIFYAGVAAVAAILVYEAWILRKGDLSRIDLAFFNLNGYVSVLFALATTADLALRGALG